MSLCFVLLELRPCAVLLLRLVVKAVLPSDTIRGTLTTIIMKNVFHNNVKTLSFYHKWQSAERCSAKQHKNIMWLIFTDIKLEEKTHMNT